MATIRHQGQRNGKDTWLIRVAIDGKQVGRTFTGTRRQAERAAYELESARDSGEPIRQSKQSVADYLTEWLETYHRPEVSKVTYAADCARVKLHILPTIGDKRLDALHTMACQRLVNGLATKGYTRTAVMVYGVLSKSLRQAKRLGLIVRNPMEDVVKPRDRAVERPFLSTDQVVQLLDSVQDNYFRAIISFLLMTGVRPEEAFGLQWQDIDLPRRTVSIVRSLKHIPAGGWEFSELKTVKSRRQLDIGQQLVEILTDHRRQQAKERLVMGARWHHRDLVFTNHNGGPVDDSKLRKHLRQALEAAKLPQIRLYDLRHTHGSMLLEQGVHIKTIADRLGHANPNVTVNRYLHVSASVSRQAVDALDVALTPKKNSQKPEAQ